MESCSQKLGQIQLFARQPCVCFCSGAPAFFHSLTKLPLCFLYSEWDFALQIFGQRQRRYLPAPLALVSSFPFWPHCQPCWRCLLRSPMYSLANWPHNCFSQSKYVMIDGPTSIMVINIRRYYSFNFSAAYWREVITMMKKPVRGKNQFNINKQVYKYLCFVITPNLHPPTHAHHHRQYTQTQSQHSSTTMMWFMRPELDAALQGNALSSYLLLL